MFLPRFSLVAQRVSLDCRFACPSAILFPFLWEALYEALPGMLAMGCLGLVPVLRFLGG